MKGWQGFCMNNVRSDQMKTRRAPSSGNIGATKTARPLAGDMPRSSQSECRCCSPGAAAPLPPTSCGHPDP